MTNHKLENYLRTYRKRSGLSQEEIMFLLHCRNGSKISRYEHFKRVPNLQTVLGYEAIFCVPVRDLFGGVFEKVEHQVAKRARLLIRRLSSRQSEPNTLRKICLLKQAIEH